MKNFRTYDLAVTFYHRIQELRLPSHVKSQLQRAALSVPLNLAEGRGKRTTADQTRFFQIALGSVREMEAIFDVVHIDSNQPLRKHLDHLAASIYLLIQRAR